MAEKGRLLENRAPIGLSRRRGGKERTFWVPSFSLSPFFVLSCVCDERECAPRVPPPSLGDPPLFVSRENRERSRLVRVKFSLETF